MTDDDRNDLIIPKEMQESIRNEIMQSVGTAVGAAIETGMSKALAPFFDKMEGLTSEINSLKKEMRANRNPMAANTDNDWDEHEANQQALEKTSVEQSQISDEEDGLNARAYRPGDVFRKKRPSSFLG